MQNGIKLLKTWTQARLTGNEQSNKPEFTVSLGQRNHQRYYQREGRQYHHLCR